MKQIRNEDLKRDSYKEVLVLSPSMPDGVRIPEALARDLHNLGTEVILVYELEKTV